MRGLGVAATVAAMLFVGGCKKAPDFGLAVAVTIDASMVPSATRASIRSLQINASGAESFSGTLALPNGLKATERTVYRPQASSGSLTIALTAIEGSSKPAAAGMATVALVAGKTVEMKIVLTTNVPTVDMAGGADMVAPPPDLAVASGDLAGAPADLGAVEDLAPIVDLRQVLDFTLPPGNHTGHGEALAGGAVGVEGSGTKKLTLSVGNKLSGRASGASHRIEFGVVRGTQP